MASAIRTKFSRTNGTRMKKNAASGAAQHQPRLAPAEPGVRAVGAAAHIRLQEDVHVSGQKPVNFSFVVRLTRPRRAGKQAARTQNSGLLTIRCVSSKSQMRQGDCHC